MTPTPPPRPSSLATDYRSLIGLSLLLATLGAGCRLVQTAVDMPGETVRAVTPGLNQKPAVDPVEVQQNLLRFADEFSTRIIAGIGHLRRGTNAMDHAEVLQWKIALASETCSIASGPNPVANLLDMTVLVTMIRTGLEEYWQPKVFGESAEPILRNCRNAETEIWLLAGKVLKPPQQAELRTAIASWHRENPVPGSLLGDRAVGFTSPAVQAGQSSTGKPGSVFDLLKLDPLSGLDPATREIAQTRLFAERALYVAQKMPVLLRWQTELLSLNALHGPEVQQMVTNTTQIAGAVDRFARTAEQLPGQVSAEREEILKALQSQEKQLTPLVNEVRQTLMSGTQMSASLNTTLITFDALMKRFGVGETNRGGAATPATNAEPFRIQDYGQTAAQLEAAARQLTELLHTLDRTLGSTNISQLAAQVAPAVKEAQAGGKEVVNYAFWKGVLLLALALAAALIYRGLTARAGNKNRN